MSEIGKMICILIVTLVLFGGTWCMFYLRWRLQKKYYETALDELRKIHKNKDEKGGAE